MTEEQGPLLVTRPSPEIVVAALHRPHRKNALTEGMFRALADLCAELRVDTSACVLVLTGTGTDFCSGYDLDEAGRIAALPPAELLGLLERQSAAVTGLRDIPQPVLAAVDGVAVGAGLSLALAADLRVVTARARLRASFVNMGLSGGDMGASWLLPRLTGLGFASEMMLTGRFVAADEALDQGLANTVTDPDDLHSTVLDLARRIAAHSPVAVALTKRVLQANADAPSLAVALEREAPLQTVAARSPRIRQAVADFRSSRAAGNTGNAPDAAPLTPTTPTEN
ncbi:enoyl-CoA hydratase/isomerase family protein [Streptomyces atratus]|uniref:Enoyl-CoA hydratase n=1 Tax=Streptomyces atratus TaxID=1893 RepID=A0A2Z5JN38_STRAR|nr:enoyl-CoA hydratase-related protein [Streptomyces atratus]AXE81847.1 enoyl-CoA hydratase [Streptomyces atratus]